MALKNSRLFSPALSKAIMFLPNAPRMQTTSSASVWDDLPAELKLAVLDNLGASDTRSLALVDRQSHALCVPALFRTVDIRSMEGLKAYLDRVPRDYARHIRELAVCTRPEAPVDAWCTQDDGSRGTPELETIITACAKLEKLSLRLWGSPSPTIISSFKHLDRLHTLSISNAAPEEHMLISERLVVGIALTVPNLASFSISGIARSLSFAPELLGSFPFVPVADDASARYPLPSAIPPPRLPSLLGLPHLRTLSIRDTHLGDPLWASVDVKAPLHTFELGACAQEAPDASQAHTERILAHPGIAGCPTLSSIALSTPVTLPPPPPSTAGATTQNTGSTGASARACADKRFAALTALRIDPHFPLYSPAGTEESPLARTLASLSTSPISTVSIRCFGDDVPDVCAELAHVLRARGRAGADCAEGYFDALEEVGVQVLADGGDGLNDCGATDAGADVPGVFDDEDGCVDVLRACCGAVRLAGVLAAVAACAAAGPSAQKAAPVDCQKIMLAGW